MVHLYQMRNVGDTGNHNKLFYSFRAKIKCYRFRPIKKKEIYYEKVKELDPYIKSRVGEALLQLEVNKTIKLTGTSRLYYTGNWAKIFTITIQKNKPEIIFKKVEKLKPHLTFFQSKLESFKDEDGKEWGGYDYYAKKI